MAGRTRRFRAKYSLEEAVKRQKLLLPIEVPNLKIELDKLINDFEPQLFQVFQRLSIPENQYDYYMAYAKRAFKLGLKFWNTTYMEELALLKQEFITRGLDQDKLNGLDNVIKHKLYKYRILGPWPRLIIVLYSRYWHEWNPGFSPVIARKDFQPETAVFYRNNAESFTCIAEDENYFYIGCYGQPDWDPGSIFKVQQGTLNVLQEMQTNCPEALRLSNGKLYALLSLGRPHSPNARLQEIDVNNMSVLRQLDLSIGDVWDLLIVGDYAYIAGNDGRLLRVDLIDFVEAGSLQMPLPCISPNRIVTDGSYIYFSGQLTLYGDLIFRIDILNFTVQDYIQLQDEEHFSWAMEYYDNNLYLGLNLSPGKIVRVRTDPFSRAECLTLNEGENGVLSLRAVGGKLYAGVKTVNENEPYYQVPLILELQPNPLQRERSIKFYYNEHYPFAIGLGT